VEALPSWATGVGRAGVHVVAALGVPGFTEPVHADIAHGAGIAVLAEAVHRLVLTSAAGLADVEGAGIPVIAEPGSLAETRDPHTGVVGRAGVAIVTWTLDRRVNTPHLGVAIVRRAGVSVITLGGALRDALAGLAGVAHRASVAVGARAGARAVDAPLVEVTAVHRTRVQIIASLNAIGHAEAF
jgi:hypothetical protein